MANKLKGDDLQGHINLARALETMHIYADAVQSYDRAAEPLPDDRTVREDRDECMRKLERSIDLA